jgi:hypothetical protein
MLEYITTRFPPALAAKPRSPANFLQSTELLHLTYLFSIYCALFSLTERLQPI